MTEFRYYSNDITFFLLTRILHVLHDDLLTIGGVDHLLALAGRYHPQAEGRKPLIFH